MQRQALSPEGESRRSAVLGSSVYAIVAMDVKNPAGLREKWHGEPERALKPFNRFRLAVIGCRVEQIAGHTQRRRHSTRK